ncbi:uncharacterized protein BP5553_07752 [Venustampulla echinocandica]|uniref:Uncharacterized protein n=1 Tax=Venustampulla echinocandica TaxID=2656787 RepID=A0A370THF1_9HELO|nr:uncharacterized protein BP5553_07752 [Venustampulla echinocandica]RDL34624.1 hypothetical protein BP5553_07752 [Venustampulla echinocandica]
MSSPHMHRQSKPGKQQSTPPPNKLVSTGMQQQLSIPFPSSSDSLLTGAPQQQPTMGQYQQSQGQFMELSQHAGYGQFPVLHHQNGPMPQAQFLGFSQPTGYPQQQLMGYPQGQFPLPQVYPTVPAYTEHMQSSFPQPTSLQQPSLEPSSSLEPPAKRPRLGIKRPVPGPGRRPQPSLRQSSSPSPPAKKLGIKRPAFTKRQTSSSSSSSGPSKPHACAPAPRHRHCGHHSSTCPRRRQPSSSDSSSEQAAPLQRRRHTPSLPAPAIPLAPNSAALGPPRQRHLFVWPKVLDRTIGEETSSKVSRRPGPMNPPLQPDWNQRQQISHLLPNSLFGCNNLPMKHPLLPPTHTTAPAAATTVAAVPAKPPKSGPQPSDTDMNNDHLVDYTSDYGMGEFGTASVQIGMEMGTPDDPCGLLPYLEECEGLFLEDTTLWGMEMGK